MKFQLQGGHIVLLEQGTDIEDHGVMVSSQQEVHQEAEEELIIDTDHNLTEVVVQTDTDS